MTRAWSCCAMSWPPRCWISSGGGVASGGHGGVGFSSGDASWWAERLHDGASALGAAELGEVVVEPGGEYATPWVYAAWSDEGFRHRRDDTTGRTHDLSFRAATALFGHFGIGGTSRRRATRSAPSWPGGSSATSATASCCTAARSCAGPAPPGLRAARRGGPGPVRGAVLLRGDDQLGERAAGRRPAAGARPRAALRGERDDADRPGARHCRPADAAARPRAGRAHRSFPGFMIPAGSHRSFKARSTPSPSSPTSAPIHGA